MNLQLFIPLVIFTLSCNPTSSDRNTASIADDIAIQELEKKGFALYQDSPEEAIQLFKQVAVHYIKQENLPKAGITHLNIANLYDERLGQTDSALVWSEKALNIWMDQHDTMQMANLYKYTGLLKGRSGKMVEAISDIHQAIRLYEEAGFAQGVAVSEINLSEVYLRIDNYTESEALFTRSTDFWNGNGDLSRVFTNNLLGIRLYTEMGKPKKAEELIHENEDILKQTELDDFIINRYHELLDEIAQKTSR